MPNRKPIAAALAALSLAGTGHALADDRHKNEIEILSISAPSSGHAVGASEPVTVGSGQTRTVPTTPLDDARLVSRGPVAGASDSTYEVYMPIKLEDTRVLPVKGPQLKAETGTGGGDHTVWVRMAQPHTTSPVMPPRLGWEVQVDSAPLEEPRLKAQTSGEQGYMKYNLEDVIVSHVSPTRSPKSPDLVAPGRDEQKYLEFKLKEVLISGVIANGNPAQSPKSPGVPPSPASTGLLKFEGGSGKPAGKRRRSRRQPAAADRRLGPAGAEASAVGPGLAFSVPCSALNAMPLPRNAQDPPEAVHIRSAGA